MATNKELEQRVKELEGFLRRIAPGIMTSERDPVEQPDYMEPGSEEHLAFLGLVRVDPDSPDQVGFDTRTSKDGKSVYRLVDPVGPYTNYADPAQAARIALLQKVESFESGPATVHDKAPKMWVPEDLKPELARLIGR